LNQANKARPGWRGKTEQEVFDEVDFWAKKGAAGFKAKGIGPKELKSLIERAHHHGLTVTGHLDSGFRGSVNPRDAIEMGIDRVEHFLGGDAMPNSKSAYSSLGAITADMPEYKKVVDLYLRTGTVFDATLTAYGYFGSPREEYEYWIDESKFFTPFIQDFAENRPAIQPMPVFEKIYLSKQQTIDDFHKAGGTITLGTDHVSNGTHLPGFGVHREMDALVRSGISESDVIKIATINGATALGIEKDHGSIEPGKSADLFVVSGNPLKNIRNARNVEKVMTRGRLYDAAKLLESVRGKLGPADESESSDW
jgi:imidazolonepropionase-like amidohydrolase